MVILLILFFALQTFASNNNEFEPWDNTLITKDRISVPAIEKKEPVYEISSLSAGFIILIRFFQVFISPQDGPHCGYIPVCSRYGYLSIRDYGFFWGTLMATDRFLRCNPFSYGGKDLPEDNAPYQPEKCSN